MTNSEMLEVVNKIYGNDKNGFLEFLRYNKCYNLLEEATKSSISTPERLINSMAVKERYKACESIFTQINFPYAVVKGAVLSQTLYSNPFLRFSGDIDIIIRREDIDSFKSLMQDNGFVQGKIEDGKIKPSTRQEIVFQNSMTHQTVPYMKATNNPLVPYINVDINMNIMWGESKQKADMNYVLSHREKTKLCGTEFYKLSSEMEFTALCLHHYKDINSLYLLVRGNFKLGLFCEIYDYLRNVYLDTKKLTDICEKLNVGKYLLECLIQTQELFGDDICQKYVDILRPYEDKNIRDTFGLSDDERKTWNISLAERIINPNLPQYVYAHLSDKEKKNVALNLKMM